MILGLRLKTPPRFTCLGTTFLDEKKNIWEADYRDDGHSMGMGGEHTKGGLRRKFYERKERKHVRTNQSHTHVTSQKSLRTLGTLKDSVVPEVRTYRTP